MRELKVLMVVRNPLTVDAIRCALKLKKKGVLVGVFEGEHNRYFRYLEVRKKPPQARIYRAWLSSEVFPKYGCAVEREKTIANRLWGATKRG